MELLTRTFPHILKLNPVYRCFSSGFSSTSASSLTRPQNTCCTGNHISKCTQNYSNTYGILQKVSCQNFGWKNIQRNAYHVLSNVDNIFLSKTHSTTCGKSKDWLLPQSTIIEKSRSVIMFSKEDGQKKSSNTILKKFRRLGNGLWLRKQGGQRRKIWKKLLKRRKAYKVYKLREIVICNKWQSKMLDKMVTSEFKKQKWYVDDPYKGYTPESHFYYHPKDLPWNTVSKPRDYYAYALRRYNRNNHERKQRSKKHTGNVNSYRQKPLPSTKSGFFYA